METDHYQGVIVGFAVVELYQVSGLQQGQTGVHC